SPSGNAPGTAATATSSTDPEVRALVDSWQYLGPERTGVIAGPRLSADWRGRPPRELWRQPVGAGWSGFAVVGDRAFTQEQQDAEECVTALRLADGAPVWTHRSPARFVSDMGGVGPRGTPTVVDGELYAVGGTGLLTRLDVATGEPAWSVDLLQDNQCEAISHGVCGSPLVWNDRVIASPTGCAQGHLAAYDRTTGRRIWRGGRDPASYGSPALAEVAGVVQVLQTTADGCEGVDPQTGETLWGLRWSNGVRVNCSQVVVVDGPAGRLLMTTGYGTGSVLFEVSPVAEGGWQTREIWRAAGAMKTKFTTAVPDGGVVYGLDDGILACLDLESGKTRWKRGRYGHGHVLRSGDLLMVQAEVPGEVVLVRVGPRGSEELGRLAGLADLTWNVPTLAGQHLLIRNDREAVCYELPLENDTPQ
ncbi:MAG: PQQ-binding-like beta-propeller repeat protein, partial [Planctomycetaceae bacterium]